MLSLFLVLLLFVDPFWQSRPPVEWTDSELSQFFANSPWAQMVPQTGKSQSEKKAGAGQLLQVYLATSGPIMKAVAERERRIELRRPGTAQALAGDPLSEERSVWFADNRERQIIVAVRVGNNPAFSSAQETRRMEQDCAMDLGRLRVKLSAFFPPTRTDPNLYLAFPREPMTDSDKTLSFELYLPGVPGPYRAVTFKVKEMIVGSKLEM
jgi:hypothetical protein